MLDTRYIPCIYRLPGPSRRKHHHLEASLCLHRSNIVHVLYSPSVQGVGVAVVLPDLTVKSSTLSVNPGTSIGTGRLITVGFRIQYC
jgi:hypothetical protein